MAPRLEATCPSRGTPVTPGKKFCRSCGLRSPPSQRAASPPRRVHPKHLAEEDPHLEEPRSRAERKQVTVLFADLKGSMELLADRDPEEARKLLDPGARAHDGGRSTATRALPSTRSWATGSWRCSGRRSPTEDHAVQACYAALRMQESVKRYAEERQRRSARGRA